MTDTSTPMGTEPSANVGGPAPVVETDAAFEENLNLFLGHSLQDADEPAPAEPPVNNPPGGDKPVPGTEPSPAPAPDPAPANGGTPPAVEAQSPASPAPAADPAVDPALLAEMMLGGEPAVPAPPAPAPAPAPVASAPPAPAGETFAPFDAAAIVVPAPLREALFNADDPEVQGKALSQLIAAIGNSVTATMESRIKEFHLPAVRDNFVQEQTRQASTNAVVQDLYSAADDLKAHPMVVQRAFALVAKQNPTAPYSPELRNKIVSLARQTIKAAGLAPAPASPPVAAPAAPAPAPYVAGGARPGGFMEQPTNGDDPGGLLDSLLFQ